ncbi:MAG: ABC transporter ATP-binding protein [Gemmatimonadetes bacterium]|nr:ABC transporter ATP-binding protein [Gemmatimonadota bacterium]
MKSLRTLIPYFRPYRQGMIAGLMLVVVSNVFTLLGPYLLKAAIDALETELSRWFLVRYALLIVLVAVVSGVSRYYMRELLNGISRRIEADLRNNLFAHLLRLPAQFYDSWRTGDLMSRTTNDVLAVRMVAGPAIMYAVNTATLSALALVLMVWIDPVLTLLAMLPLALLPASVFYYGRQIHARFERIQSQFSELSNFMQEYLSGIRIVKAYTQEDSQVGQFRALNEEYLARNMSLARVWGAFHPSLTLFTGVGAAIVLWYGGGQVIAGRITLGAFVAFGFYLTLLSWPMIALGWVTNLFQRGAASMQRINELMAISPAIADGPAPIPTGVVRGRVELRAVSFRYPGTDRWVLRDVSLVIEPGQTAAIVGATGSGKTTLVRLIARLYDATEGEVLFDGIDVRRLALDELRAAVSVVPQEPFLFGMRLRRNIALASGEADEVKKLMKAVDIAHLTEALADLPEGLDTRLGERGINLSGGQKQRATLARAIYQDAPLLILDDALSSVDSATETAILRELREYMHGRTAILISHRVSAVRDADVIFVLEEGQLVEEGRHEELLALNGVYKRLLERQLLSEEIERGEALVGRPSP